MGGGSMQGGVACVGQKPIVRMFTSSSIPPTRFCAGVLGVLGALVSRGTLPHAERGRKRTGHTTLNTNTQAHVHVIVILCVKLTCPPRRKSSMKVLLRPMSLNIPSIFDVKL